MNELVNDFKFRFKNKKKEHKLASFNVDLYAKKVSHGKESPIPGCNTLAIANVIMIILIIIVSLLINIMIIIMNITIMIIMINMIMIIKVIMNFITTLILL